jgi:putative endonuclease
MEDVKVELCYFCGKKYENHQASFQCKNCGNIVRICSNKRNFFVYLLECSNSTIYTGITTDVERRISEHRKGKGSKYVVKKGVNRLLATWICTNRSEALRLEYKIKQLSHTEKRQLVSHWNNIETKEPFPKNII